MVETSHSCHSPHLNISSRRLSESSVTRDQVCSAYMRVPRNIGSAMAVITHVVIIAQTVACVRVLGSVHQGHILAKMEATLIYQTSSTA